MKLQMINHYQLLYTDRKLLFGSGQLPIRSMQGATVLDTDYPLITSATLPLEVASCTAPLVCRKLHDSTTQRLSWNKPFFNPKNSDTINYSFIEIFICQRVNRNHYPQNETIMAPKPQGLLLFSVGLYMSTLVSSDQSFQRLSQDSSEERKKQHFFFFFFSLCLSATYVNYGTASGLSDSECQVIYSETP